MKKFFLYFFCLIILFALNSVFPQLPRGVAPNFIFLFAIFYALKKQTPDFLWIAFFGGLILDLFSGNLFGSYTLALICICSLLAYATGTFFTADLSIEITSIFLTLGYLAFVILLFLINWLGLKSNLIGYQISPKIFETKVWLDLFLNLIFAVPVYYLTVFNDKILAKKAFK